MKVSLAAGALTGVSALLLALSGPAYRLGASLPTAFTMLRWGAYIALVAFLVATVATVLASRKNQWAAMAVGILFIAMSAAVFGVPYAWQQRAQGVPPIHDITTDLENPPMFDAVVPLRADAPNTLERPADLAVQQRRGYPDLQPITLPLPPAEAFELALAVAQESGWEIVAADTEAGRIEATDTTFWFGFKDDVVVRLTPWGTGTRVDVRSVSRVGRSDVGTNARRIRQYLEDLQAR